MDGGNYYTWFKSEDAESRKILYLLESLGIARLKTDKLDNKGQYKYEWELTKKGENLIKSDKNLQELWKAGRIIEFYQEIKRILEN